MWRFYVITLLLQAEELMRKIEKEEEQVAYQDPEKKIYHLCIVNLVIGYKQSQMKNFEMIKKSTIGVLSTSILGRLHCIYNFKM